MVKTKKVEIGYKAKEGSRLSDNQANIYGQHLLNLMKLKSKQELTPKEVLEDAKLKTTPYHDWFNWDDTSAAEEYRLMQARQLLASIVEVKIIHGEEKPTRVFVNVRNDEGERIYTPTSVAVKNSNMVNQVLVDAMREVNNWRTKYSNFYELSKIHGAIDLTKEELQVM